MARLPRRPAPRASHEAATPRASFARFLQSNCNNELLGPSALCLSERKNSESVTASSIHPRTACLVPLSPHTSPHPSSDALAVNVGVTRCPECPESPVSNLRAPKSLE